ncbi:MAG: hypothetical protein JRF02_09290 [Deltaproteobacteria bacterium]|jgi:hypothetical protein|nr:hypothetical protein [Deltaproteobacteria bacterium]
MQNLPSASYPNQSTGANQQITVKFLTRGLGRSSNKKRWSRQLPGSDLKWNNCKFTFDIDADKYDWLVVYHDLPRDKFTRGIEKLRCPRENTILITTEPSSITVYGSYYLQQFGRVITSQESWAIKHPHTIFTQPGLIWFYGASDSEGKMLTYDEIKDIKPPEKHKSISTVCSIRQGRLTLHYKRFHFTERLKEEIPELDVFGHGVNPMSDKAEALDPYRFHITVENHVFPNHMTEKLPDAFLGYTVPFYHGCPNATDYFPRESFIPIDMNNFRKTVEIIRSTLANNEYEDRLPYIIEARRRVLEEHNLFAVIEKEITKQDNNIEMHSPEAVIMGRSALKIRKPIRSLGREIEKILLKIRHIHW